MDRRTGTRSWTAAIGCLAWVVCGLTLAGCGAASRSAGLPSGTWSTTVTGAEEPFNGRWSQTFSDGGSVDTVRHDGRTFVTEAAAVHGHVVTFSRGRGRHVCSSSGKYAFKRSGNHLTFQNVGDTCIGREIPLRHGLTKTG